MAMMSHLGHQRPHQKRDDGADQDQHEDILLLQRGQQQVGESQPNALVIRNIRMPVA